MNIFKMKKLIPLLFLLVIYNNCNLREIFESAAYFKLNIQNNSFTNYDVWLKPNSKGKDVFAKVRTVRENSSVTIPDIKVGVLYTGRLVTEGNPVDDFDHEKEIVVTLGDFNWMVL